MLTDEQGRVAPPVRRRAKPHTINEAALGVRAARELLRRNLSLGVAAREFGIKRASVQHSLAKLKRRHPAPPSTVIPESRCVQAARHAHSSGVSLAEAARAFGLASSTVGVTWKRLYPGVPKPVWVHPTLRAEQAARRAHDEPCTRMRAARLFGVPEASVIAAWERLYPDNQRMRT